MCRLFGLSSAPAAVAATFWLLTAPDSLSAQSHRMPDGAGLGYFDASGKPHRHRKALAAYKDQVFARDAQRIDSQTFVAHVRYASTGGLTLNNTHPFEQHGRLFAHNGMIDDLPTLDLELGEYRRLVHGDTDSERFFALITKHADANGGDVAAAITSASQWIADHLRVYAMNVVLISAGELWALRYPETHPLWVLRRVDATGQELRHADRRGRLRVHAPALANGDATVVATERMDDDPRWRLLASGELLHVSADGVANTSVVLPEPPAQLLTLADLRPEVAQSQHA